MKHNEGFFQGHKGTRIYHQRWLPDGEPRAVLLVAHGYGEHSGRYANFVDHFVPRGYAVYALDHRGHGRSEGPRVQVEHYSDYLTDLKTLRDMARTEQPRARLYLIGHSMGASIALAYAARHQDGLDGLVLSGGGITPRSQSPSPPPRPAGFDLASTLSRDAAVIEAYRSDPLVYHGPPLAGAAGMAAMREDLPALVPRITLPVLIMAGGASPLGDAARSAAAYEAIGSLDRTLKVYDGLMHEIFNEPEHPAVMKDLEAWLEGRLG